MLAPGINGNMYWNEPTYAEARTHGFQREGSDKQGPRCLDERPIRIALVKFAPI